MSNKQWGHGFHKGREQGQSWGELMANGKWEDKLCDISTRLVLLSNSLKFPVEVKSGRTEVWWQLYVSAIAKQIDDIAKELPSTIGCVYEFEDDIPKEKETTNHDNENNH